jgi:hypothetical protein
MIRILDQNFKILETIIKYTSVEFVKVFNDYGTFTVQIPLEASPKEIQRNRILRHKNNYGIIRYISQSDGYIVIQGQDLKVLLTQRCIQNTRSGISETVIKEYVAEATSGSGRNFPNFSVAADQTRGLSVNYKIEKPIMADEAIREICSRNDWGYDVKVNNGSMVFDVLVPRVLDVTYSKRHENIKDYEYICDALEERNAVINYAEWEGLEVESDTAKAEAVVKAGRGHFADGKEFEILSDVTVSTYTQSSTYIYARKDVSSGVIDVTRNNSPLYNTSTTHYSLIATISSSGTVALSDRYTIIKFSPVEETGVEMREIVTNYSGTYEEIREACLNDITGTVAESVEAEILTSTDYGTKWNLGDYVKVRVRVMGGELTVTKQITQVTETYEANNHKVIPVFGPIRETAFKKLARGRL